MIVMRMLIIKSWRVRFYGIRISRHFPKSTYICMGNILPYQKVYGDCPGLLDIVVKHLERHDGVDIPEPVFKARLLTDGEVDKWEAYKQLGTPEELREVMDKQTHGWIPCSERLPEAFDNVLVCTKEGGRAIAHRCPNQAPGRYYDLHSSAIDDVIAWQPLPNPYIPE